MSTKASPPAMRCSTISSWSGRYSRKPKTSRSRARAGGGAAVIGPLTWEEGTGPSVARLTDGGVCGSGYDARSREVRHEIQLGETGPRARHPPGRRGRGPRAVSYTHLRAHETRHDL